MLLSSFHYSYTSCFEVLIAFQYLMALMMPIPHVVRRRINCSGATAATTARQVVDDREFEQSRENECSASSHPNINCFYVRDLRGFSVQTWNSTIYQEGQQNEESAFPNFLDWWANLVLQPLANNWPLVLSLQLHTRIKYLPFKTYLHTTFPN